MTRAPKRQGRPPRKDDPARLVVRIPTKLKDRLRLEALRRGLDMGDLVKEALDRYLPRVVQVTAGADDRKRGTR